MYRTPNTKTDAKPSTSRATDSPKDLNIDQTPKRQIRTLTHIIKRRPTTPVTPVPEMNMANTFNRPCPGGYGNTLVKEEKEKADYRYDKIKRLLKSSRNLKKEIYEQAIKLVEQMHAGFNNVASLCIEQRQWMEEQRGINVDEYETIQNAYLEVGAKKQALRRELSDIKDRLEKETATTETQTETDRTSKWTQTDSKIVRTTSTNTIAETKTIQSKNTDTAKQARLKATEKTNSTSIGIQTEQTEDIKNDKTEEHITLLRQNIESNDQLRQSIDQLKQQTKDKTSTKNQDKDGLGETREITGVWENKNRQEIQPTLYSLVVAPTDSLKASWTAENVLTRVRETLNATSGEVEVERVRKAKDAKVIVSCRTVAARSIVSGKLSKAKKEITVEEIKNKDPLIVLKEVSKHNTDEDILAAIKRQNRDVFERLEDADVRLTILYKRPSKNPQAHHIVLRVSPSVWRLSTEKGMLFIDLQRVRVLDQSPLVQCSICLGYGHSRKFCTETVERCSHCGGNHKLGRQCADWLAGTPPSCTNCAKAKVEKSDHNAFDAVCTIRKKWDALARSTVAYG